MGRTGKVGGCYDSPPGGRAHRCSTTLCSANARKNITARRARQRAQLQSHGPTPHGLRAHAQHHTAHPHAAAERGANGDARTLPAPARVARARPPRERALARLGVDGTAAAVSRLDGAVAAAEGVLDGCAAEPPDAPADLSRMTTTCGGVGARQQDREPLQCRRPSGPMWRTRVASRRAAVSLTAR